MRVFILILLSLLASACGTPQERAQAYVVKADALFDAEDYVGARIEALNAVQIEPKNAKARYLLAQIEEQNKNFREAVGHLSVAVDADPTLLPARLKLGNYYVIARAAELAAVQSRAAMELAPDNSEVRLLNARILFLKEDIAGAEKEVDKALEIDPLLMEAIMFKAGIEANDGEFDSALMLVDNGIKNAGPDKVASLRQFRVLLLRAADRMGDVEAELKALVRDYPDEGSYAASLAQLFVSQGRVDEAEEVLRGLVAVAPDDVGRQIGFVRFVAENRSIEQAIDVLGKFIAESPDQLELSLALGRLYEATGAREQAFDVYTEIASIAPTSKEGLAARNRIVLINIAENKFDGARKLVKQILADESDNSEARLASAAFNFSDRNYDNAIADLRTVLRHDEKSERALLLLARSHVGAGSAELAQDAYRRLLEVDPSHPSASSELAELLARGGDMDLAEDVLRKRLEIEPEDPRAASGLVQALLMQGDVEAAEAEARDMLAFADPSGLAEFRLGQVLQAKESGPEAIEAYERALEKNPEAAQPLQGLIRVLVESDRADDAVAYLKEHMEKYPEQRAPKLLLGSTYARQGKVDAAREQFDWIVEKEPGLVQVYSAIAGLYPGHPEKRIAAYRQGLDANPGNPALSLLLASEYERLQQVDDAIALYEQVLAENPDVVLAINNLAALLLDHRSDAESYARALDLATSFANSTQPALVDTLGWAYYRNGDFNSAIRYLEQAVEGAGQVPLLRYHLGMAYLAVQDRIRGREELETAIESAETDFVGIEEARTALAAIQKTTASRPN